MNEPSPRQAEANDMELVTTRASPSAEQASLTLAPLPGQMTGEPAVERAGENARAVQSRPG